MPDEAKGAEVELNPVILIAMFDARNSEIRSRIGWRDAVVYFAMVLSGSMYIAGVFALVAPVALLFLGAMWLHHDQRVAQNAEFLRKSVEPRMQKLGGVEGFDSGHLDRTVRPNYARVPFTGAMMRLTFPGLQLATVGLGVYRYIALPHHNGVATAAVIVAVVLDLAIVALTFAKVKHHRTRVTAPAASPPNATPPAATQPAAA